MRRTTAPAARIRSSSSGERIDTGPPLKRKLQAIPFACPPKAPSDVRISNLDEGAKNFAQGYVSANRCFRTGQTMVQVTHCSGPSKKALACLGSGLPRSWSPQENGARKRRFKKCLSYMLSGIGLLCGRSPTFRSLEHDWRFHGHSLNEGLRRRRRRAQAVVEGAAIGLTVVSQSDDCCGSHLDNH